MTTGAKCPFNHGARRTTNQGWWPKQLRLDLLQQHSAKSDPMGAQSWLGAETRYSGERDLANPLAAV